jgi:hypothetical protein
LSALAVELPVRQHELLWHEVPGPTGLRAWFIKYGVWLLIGIPALGWEITAFLWQGSDHAYAHPTISNLVKRFESRTGWVGNTVVTVGLCALFLHWVVRLY